MIYTTKLIELYTDRKILTFTAYIFAIANIMNVKEWLIYTYI